MAGWIRSWRGFAVAVLALDLALGAIVVGALVLTGEWSAANLGRGLLVASFAPMLGALLPVFEDNASQRSELDLAMPVPHQAWEVSPVAGRIRGRLDWLTIAFGLSAAMPLLVPGMLLFD